MPVLPPHRLVVLFLLLFLPLSAAVGKQESDRPPNIIFFLADDLGWNGPGCYGSDLHETPHLDQLAADGLKFLDGYAACTVCSPTRAAAMTGISPARLHVTNWIPGTRKPLAKLKPPEWTMQLDHRHVTIAEVLNDAGYKTAHFGKWHLGDKDYYPETHGFDKNIAGTSNGSPPGGYFLPNNLDLPHAVEGEYLTDHLATRALKLIDDWQEEAFFFYFPFYTVHTPIQGKPELVEHYRRKIEAQDIEGERTHSNPEYAAMVHSLDEAVGRILAKIEEVELTANTVIIFTSDNGGLSHKQGKPTGITLNSPLRRGKGSAYEGSTRVPLIIKWPGVTPAGSITHEPASTIDFYPTILDIVGVEGNAAHNADVEGKSLVPVLKDPTAKLARESLFWHFPHYHAGGDSPYGAVRSRDWKLVEFYEDNNVELYNLVDDLSETNNLASQHPEKVELLRKQLHDWRLSADAQMLTPNPAYDPANLGADPPKKRNPNAAGKTPSP